MYNIFLNQILVPLFIVILPYTGENSYHIFHAFEEDFMLEIILTLRQNTLTCYLRRNIRYSYEMNLKYELFSPNSSFYLKIEKIKRKRH